MNLLYLSFNVFITKAPVFAWAFRFVFFFIMVNFLSTIAVASEAESDVKIPHVNKKARYNFNLFQQADGHKAFAIAPGGAWAWNAEMASVEEAESEVLKNCQRSTRQKCVLYTVDDQIVFNHKKWPTLWAPYVTAKDSKIAPNGTNKGERFYNLAYKDKKGRTKLLSDSKGKLVLLHFWGSWCSPCLREFPELKKLHKQLKRKFADRINMIFLQVREPFNESQQWAKKNGFASLPLYDSGSQGSEDSTLKLAQQEQILDREVARVFPSSYILDRNGVVLFSHTGSIESWQEYIPFIKHAILHSEKVVVSKHEVTTSLIQ